MDGSPLFFATQVVLQNLSSLAAQSLQSNLAWDFESELRRITKWTEKFQALLNELHEAEKGRGLYRYEFARLPKESQAGMEKLQDWLKNLKAVACNVEDILDEFTFEVLRAQNRMKNKVRNFFSNPLAFRLRIADRIKNTNSMMDEIYQDAINLGLGPTTSITSEPREFMPTNHPFVDDSEVVGRDGDVSIVVDMLLHSSVNDGLSIIAIVGRAGLGKSTLARLVYNDEKVVKNYSDQRMWVCVSDDFNIERLLNGMVQSLTGDQSEETNIDILVSTLQEKLNYKKYLLVLDNIWNIIPDKWEHMRYYLLEIGGSKESKIIVTTCNIGVLSTMQTSPCLTHHLVKLPEEDSWAIFRKRAFADGGPSETPYLVAIGREMVKRCKGVPLAIKSLGALMNSKQYGHQWMSILWSEIWSSHDNQYGILPPLRLSFDHLPSPYLKQCFAYCSVFPKGFDIEKDKLIQLWMSQGYLQSSLEKKLATEDVGNIYFNNLLHYFCFQDVKMDQQGNITSCKMHNIVHDLAQHVSNGSCLTLMAGEVKDYHEVQHLSLNFGAETSLEIPRENVGKLRTLFLTGNLPENIADVKHVRALALEQNDMEELPGSVSKFIHLRYLDLSRTKIRTLPDFVTKLYNLETLRLPSSLYMEDLPEEFHKFFSLGHKQVVPMVRDSDKEELSLVAKAYQGHEIEELGHQYDLRILEIRNLEQVRNRAEAETTYLSRKAKIHKLELYWSNVRDVDRNNDEDVLEGLKPHTNLRCLTVNFFEGERFASWMMTRSGDNMMLPNLVRITLSDCTRCEQIPPLGHLPNLKFVDIHGFSNVKSIGPEFYGHSVVNCDYDGGIVGGSSSTSGVAGALSLVFPELRELHLGSMGRLEEWSEAEVSSSAGRRAFFPWLEDLLISCCSLLVTIPSHLLPFQELYIRPFTENALLHLRNFKRTYFPRLTIMVDWPEVGIHDLLKDVLENFSQSLRMLTIYEWYGLRCLPNKLQNLVSLEKLEIFRCHDLNSIIEETEAFGGLTYLEQLRISECSKLTCLPERLLQTLVTLEIKQCPNLIMANPDELLNLTSLQALTIVSCPGLASSWDEGLLCLTSLQRLEIGRFSEEVENFPWPSVSADVTVATAKGKGKGKEIDHHYHHPQQNPFVSLESLVLVGWPKLKSLPDQLQRLVALTELSIEHFDGLEVLPEWLGNLLSLRSLQLRHCKNLMGLPSMEAMLCLTHLQSLAIEDCSLLEERCKMGSGQEWSKIYHIPSIEFIPKRS